MISNRIPKLIIIEDHTFTREGVAKFLRGKGEIEMIGEFSETRSLLNNTLNLNPDIILLDLNLPGMNGEISCRLLKQKFPDTKIIAFTEHLIDNDELIDLGFDGRYMKWQETGILLEAIQIVLKGQKYFSAPARKLTYSNISETEIHPYLASKNITKRELEILKLYIKDYSNREIAEKLFISETTVNTHKRNIKQKIGKNKKKELKLFLSSIGLIE